MKTHGSEKHTIEFKALSIVKNKRTSTPTNYFISPLWMRILPCLFLLSSINFIARAELCIAVSNGDWSAPSTWSCGHAPSDEDTIRVPFGRIVTVDINSPVYCNMVVIIDGTLIFDVGQKINICPGEFTVSASGVLDGGVFGSKINICGNSVWNGPGPDQGPLFWSSWPLVVKLIYFEGIQNENVISISWITETETNNDYFTLERNTNGLTFEEIGSVKGNGTSSQPHNYSFIDRSPLTGTNYYRLTQTDFNGQSEIIRIIAVEFYSSISDCILSIYPNPCVSNFTVMLSDCPEDNNGNFTIQIIDASGKIVKTIVPERNANGGFSYIMDENNILDPGVYIIRGTTTKFVFQQKAILK